MSKAKSKGYWLGLITSVALGAMALPVNARTTKSVGNIGNGAALLPTGQTITPSAAPGSSFDRLSTGLRQDGSADAAEAVTTTLSPNGKTLLVLTSGYNQNFKTESGSDITYPVLDPVSGQPSSITTRKAEWVFVFDVSSGALVKKQQINIPNTYNGLTWAPDGKRFYVSAGIDDRVYVYKLGDGGQFVPDAPFILLGHNTAQTAPFPKYDGGLLNGTAVDRAKTGAVVAGVAVSKDGKTLVAANFENDSISIVDTESRKVLQELKFFTPGSKTATGEYPFDVAIKSQRNSNDDDKGKATKVFVSSQRDDEVLAVDLQSGGITRIPVGSQPNKILLSRNQRLLYVANGNNDSISVIDTEQNKVVRTLSLSRPGDKYKGANPNSLALSKDGKTLYVTLGGENAVAVVDLQARQVVGRIPTGWYPNSVSVSKDGSALYVVNAKSTSGPAPSNGRTTAEGRARNTTFRNEYNWALEKAGISIIPVPNSQTLVRLSRLVDRNNGFDRRRQDPKMAFLRSKIKHVIYVVKENRTYDQVLGDLPKGNGDPALTTFPEAVSPNHHKLANDFVTLDNFYDSGESSGVGWNWSTYARTTDYTEKSQSVLYGNAGFNGLTYDYEGTNRNINNALPQTGSNQFNSRVTGLLDPSGNSAILPGPKDVNAPEGDGELDGKAIGGYLWDSALRLGKTVRNYGFFIDLAYYDTAQTDPNQPDPTNPLYIRTSRTPFADNIPQSPVGKVALQDKTDVYFRGYDNKFPDIYRVEEWERDVKQNGLPSLSMVRIMRDHFGSFGNSLAGVNTPELQMADNDYALGLLVEKVSKMPEWKSTAIVVIEDDSQDGPDHVDGHRSLAYIISPYTKRGAVVSTNYNTVSILRTIEDLLGIDYLSTTDANAEPMSDVFTTTPNLTRYKAVVPGNLCKAPVDPTLVGSACQNPDVQKTAALPLLHNGAWWEQATQDFYFEVEDKLDAGKFNRVLWAGVRGEQLPYPTERNGIDWRQNRAQRLQQWRLSSDRLSVK